MEFRRYDLRSMVLRVLPIETLYDSELCGIPLFHGTDSFLLKLPDEARQMLRMACFTVIDYAYPIMQSHGVGKMRRNDPNGIFGKEQYRILDAYTCASGLMDGNKWYQYDSFYVTANPDKALSYARRSYIFGELGYIADSLLTGLDTLNWSYTDVTDQQREAINIIRTVTSTIVPNPVVLMYIGIPKSQIKDENGEEVNWEQRLDLFLNGINEGSFRIIGNFDISEGNIIDLDSIPTIDK